MARPRQPVNLLEYKGKKHLTKKEIEERKATEVKAPNDKVKPPTYLPKDLKREFKKIASELLGIGIITNLDVDALARFLLAKKMYLEVTQSLLEISPVNIVNDMKFPNEAYSDLVKTQDKLFKQCRSAATDLGLTISSRCKLVIPKQEKKQAKNEAEKRFGDRV